MQNFIAKFPEKAPSQDYARLRAQGIEHIQRLCHERWTDYNVHDPGITVLELLCYAITELGYRASYPMIDLLTAERQGVALNPGDFHTAREVLSAGPITFTDLRKLLVDIRGVRNAWVVPHCEVRYFLDVEQGKLGAEPGPHREQLPALNGLYEVLIEKDDSVQREERLVGVGVSDRAGAFGDFVEVTGQGLCFDVVHPVTLRSVRLYADVAGELRLRLVAADGVMHAERTVSVGADAGGTAVELGFGVPPGAGYRLEAAAALGGPRLFRSEAAAFPQPLKDVLVLTGSSQGSTALDGYYFFYGLQVTYAVVPLPLGASARRTLTLARLGKAPLAPVEAAEAHCGLHGFRPLTLHAVTVHADAAGEVTLELAQANGQVISRTALGVEQPGPLRVPLACDLAAGERYTLRVAPTSPQLRAASVAYPLGEALVLELTRAAPGQQPLCFFDWEVSHATQPEPDVLTAADLRLGALDRVLRHRNLCEDVVAIHDLDTEQIALCADIEVKPGVDLDELLARLHQELHRHVSPPVRFYTIEELLQRGRSVQQTFAGPKLDHGFIDDDEFEEIQRRSALKGSDIVRIVMDLEGVVAVKSLLLLSFVGGQLRAQDAWLLPLAADRLRAPEFSPELSKIVFYKNRLPYYPSRSRVAELLRRRQAGELPSKLAGHDTDLPVPVGEHRALGEYEPIQNELPAAYQVGQQRVARSEPPLRHAQARQFKAYLMFFEQLIANHLAQLSHINELFSWKSAPQQTYFTQTVQGVRDRGEIMNQALIDAEYGGSEEAALAALVEQAPAAARRKTRFLDHVLGRYAENLEEYTRLMFGMQGQAVEQRLLEDKRALLLDYPRVGYGRARGFDYRAPGSADNVSGLERRVCLLLGIRALGERHLAGQRLRIEAAAGRWYFVLKNEAGADVFVSKDCESRATIEVLLDAALEIGKSEQSYQQKADHWELARDCEEQAASDRSIGRTTSLAVLAEVVSYFARVYQNEGLHVVEHVLLRPRQATDPFLSAQLDPTRRCDCPSATDPYSFRITVLLPAWPERFQDLRFRHLVEQTVRREAPAHILAKVCWISHESMREMEQRIDAFEAASRRLGDLEGLPLPTGGAAPNRLPSAGAGELARQAYTSALSNLCAGIEKQVNVYPLARLHDCEETSSQKPAVSLNNTSLGTF